MEVDFGRTFSEYELKLALRELVPGIHFDMGASLNLHHPKIDVWQGVFVDGRHVGTMDRGVLPEYNIYRLERTPTGQKVRGEVIRVGWRTTLEHLVRGGVTTWAALSAKLGVEPKQFVGDPAELGVFSDVDRPLR